MIFHLVKIRDISAKFSFFFFLQKMPTWCCRVVDLQKKRGTELAYRSLLARATHRSGGTALGSHVGVSRSGIIWMLAASSQCADAGFVGWLRKCTENPMQKPVFFAFLRQEFHWNSQRNCCCLERKPLGHDWGWYVLCGCYLVWGSSKNHEHQNSNAGFLGAYFRHSQKTLERYYIPCTCTLKHLQMTQAGSNLLNCQAILSCSWGRFAGGSLRSAESNWKCLWCDMALSWIAGLLGLELYHCTESV